MRIVIGGASAIFAVEVYFGVPRPVPARGSKGLQLGETGVRGAVCFCASTGVGAQINCCAYDGCGPVFRAAGEWGRLRRASLCSASWRIWEVCEL